MDKGKVYTLIFMLLFAYLGLSIFQMNAYLIVFLLVVFMGFYIHQENEIIERKTNLENKELMNEIKTTTRDAYLKHKQLMTMITNIPSPLLLLDVEGKVVLYNSYFNYLRDTDEEKELSYFENDCKEEVADFLKDAYIYERNLNKNVVVDDKTYNAISVPVTTNSKFSGCVILFQDISEAKEKESLQKQFIADASHELKTPISVIKGMIEILNREDFEDEATEIEFHKQIEKETRRLEIIVRDLLQLSRLSMDNLILNRKSIDFTNTIENSVDSFKMLAKEKGIKIKTDFHTNEKVFIDSELMTTLLNNLISNAIKYSDHGEILIKTEKKDNEYLLSVKDDGVGLSEEDRNRIFERFYRVDKARSRNNGGSGLGLSILKSIVEAHRGRLEVESKLNQGSVFKIYLQY